MAASMLARASIEQAARVAPGEPKFEQPLERDESEDRNV
jgi:hypothetical protein